MEGLTGQGYRQWRRDRLREHALSDDASAPAERLLQAIWAHQRLRHDDLVTLDGQRLQVLHPGFQNLEPGPDFRGAVIRFGNEAPCTCDVEVDLISGGWQAHRHHVNPAFDRVRLHVIWEVPRHVRPETLPRPTLALRPFLDASLEELSLTLGLQPRSTWPASYLGQCAEPLERLARGCLEDLLTQAALVRLENKARRFQARARQAGWEQAMWEGLFRALGYKHNTWPMERLARLRVRLLEGLPAQPSLTLQARLFGVAGLLPEELPRRSSAADVHLRRLWDIWWRERDAWAEEQIPRTLWKLGGVRPANHPHRRLALAAHWLTDLQLPTRLQRWSAEVAVSSSALPTALAKISPSAQDTFWSRHWTLNSRVLSRPMPLLGLTRLTDLAVNVFLPWLWARADAEERAADREHVESLYLRWPAAQDNSVLRLARGRLFGRRPPKGLFRRAAMQQGLLQIVRDFCDHSNALCQGCHFPFRVGSLPSPGTQVAGDREDSP